MSVKISALLCFIYVSLFSIVLFSFISRPKNEVKNPQEIKFAPDIEKKRTSNKHDYKSRKIVHKHDHKEDWLGTRRKINQARLQNLQKTCQAHPELFLHEEMHNAQVINKLEILSCPIAKAGSTSLKETIRIIQSKIKDKSLPAKRHDQNHTFDTNHVIKNSNVNEVTMDYKKFLIVREPMERLVSAFNDLFIVSDRKGLQREALKVRGARNRKITFNDFIKAVVLPQDSVVSKSTLGKVGKHWAPYYKICAPCFMDFDYIGILDPSQEENKFIWEALGVKISNFQWSNAKFIKSQTTQDTKEKLLSKVYSKLSRSTLIKLYRKYKMDYDLFGFDFNEVLYLAGHFSLTQNEENLKPNYF